jgi:hypothetical protein
MTFPFKSSLKNVLLLACLPLLACTTVVDSDQVQCTLDSDCAQRGGAFANSLCQENLCIPNPNWYCLATKRVPAGPGPFLVSVPGTADVMTQLPTTGATITLCRKLDPLCSNPVDSQTIEFPEGVTFTVESGFAGYLQANVSGYLPSLYFFNPPVDHDQTIPPISVASQGEYAALMSILGIAPDTTRGTAILLAYDCTGKTATGVSYTSPYGDALSKSFYYAQGLPSTIATATDAFGYGGMANLPPGSVSVSARLESPKAELPFVSLIVRPLTLSFAQVVPYAN